MRLLVYGGNLYDERRRIGAWPQNISVVVLQERYGLSERKPAFGVGFTDETPYLIFRRIQPHGDRSYPITVLLDPGEAVWNLYEWNGAHLLHALFVEEGSPGARLLSEAEKFHSRQDVESLFQELGRRQLPEAEVAEDEEKIWLWWLGSLSSPKPVVAVPDGEVVGLNSRPLIPSMARLLTRVVPSLRCGKGWLIGGNQGQVKPFGVHFVFDDGKDLTDAAGAAAQIQEALRLGREQADAADLANRYGGDGLKDFFKLPLAQWEKQSGYTAQELFSELRLLRSVSQSPVARSDAQTEETFRELVQHLEGRKGPMYWAVCEAAWELACAGNATLTPEKTQFVLFYACELKKCSVEPELVERLNDEAAVSFFVGKRLPPSEAGELMPAKYRVAVLRSLLAKAAAEEVPRLFAGEVEALRRLPGPPALKELGELAADAVEYSATGVGGLTQLWSAALGVAPLRELLLPALCGPARLAAGNGIRELLSGAGEPRAAGRPAWLRDYILYGEDAGGRWLAGQNLSREAAGAFVRLVIQASEFWGGTPPYAKQSMDWLAALARSELRPQVPVAHKQEIVDRLSRLDSIRESWLPLNALLKLFYGSTVVSTDAARKVIVAREQEQGHLLNELRELVAFTIEEVGEPDEAPNLTGLVALFGDDCRDEVLRALSQLHPPLTKPGAKPWLKAWLRFSGANEGATGELPDVFHREWIRYLLESDSSPADDPELPSAALVTGFSPEKLKELYTALLFDGGPEQDARYAALLPYVLQLTGSLKLVRTSLDEWFGHFEDAAKREQFLRRHRDEKTLALLKNFLTDEQRERLEAELVKQREVEVESYSLLTRKHLLETPVEKFHEEFTAFKNAAGKGIAGEALRRAFLAVASQPADREAFLKRLGDNKRALTLLRDSLPNESLRGELNGMADEHRYQQLRLKLRECLSGGGGVDDVGGRSNLMEILLKLDQEGVRLELDEDLKAVRADLEQWENFKRRFVRMNMAYRSRQKDLKALDAIFGHIRWAMQREILLSLYNSDKGSFERMVENIFNELQEKRKIVSPFQGAVVTFLKAEGEIAQIVKQYLITETRRFTSQRVEAILRLAAAPPADAGRREPAPDAPADEATRKPWHENRRTMFVLILLAALLFIGVVVYNRPAADSVGPSALPDPAPPTTEASPAGPPAEPTPEAEATPAAVHQPPRVSPEASLRRARPRGQQPRRQRSQ